MFGVGPKTLGVFALVSAIVFIGLDTAGRTLDAGTLTLFGGAQPFAKK